MTQRNRPDDRDTETELKFYLPAGSPSSSAADWIERVWATLFNHGVETPS